MASTASYKQRSPTTARWRVISEAAAELKPILSSPKTSQGHAVAHIRGLAA
ncbi:MAG: hypothetical protein AABN33_21405 [Acidobacteriota bacterium]